MHFWKIHFVSGNLICLLSFITVNTCWWLKVVPKGGFCGFCGLAVLFCNFRFFCWPIFAFFRLDFLLISFFSCSFVLFCGVGQSKASVYAKTILKKAPNDSNKNSISWWEEESWYIKYISESINMYWNDASSFFYLAIVFLPRIYRLF